MVCRGTQSDYIGESFDAIVGYRGNGAIIHYKPEQETAASSDFPAMLNHVDELLNEAHDHLINFKKYAVNSPSFMKKFGADVKALEKALNDALMASGALVNDMEDL